MSERDVVLDRVAFEEKIRHAATATIDGLHRYQAAARVAGSTAAAAVLTLAVIYGPHTMSERQLAATVKMERLAAGLERVKKIPPETASEIARIINRPEFDCARVSCRPTLESRNKTARSHLLALIELRTPSDVSSVGRAPTTAGADR